MQALSTVQKCTTIMYTKLPAPPSVTRLHARRSCSPRVVHGHPWANSGQLGICTASSQDTQCQDTQNSFAPSITMVPSNSVPGSRLVGIAVKACCLVLACTLFQHTLVPYAHAAVATTGAGGGNALATLLSFVLHLDHHLLGMIEQHGRATYAILFAIVFCETGLVLTPFLPGDSLLFAAGAFAGMGKLDVATLMAVFLTSAILGDAVNYLVGNKLGGWAVKKGLVKQEYIAKTEKFYDKYGGKTVVLARFVPIIRTFAPFVAGVGSMTYSKFALYNVGGAVLWSVLFVGGGFFFGNLPFVQKNFTLVVLAIVAVSVVPVIFEILNARKEAQQEGKQ